MLRRRKSYELVFDVKILHLSCDEKFVDSAYSVFELAFPGCNDVFIFSSNFPLKYVSLEPKKIISTGRSSYNKPKLNESDYADYDLIIFHSLNSALSPETFIVPKSIPKVWIGWGFDYYDEIYSLPELLLEESKRYRRESVLRPGRFFSAVLRRISPIFESKDSKKNAMVSADIFCPVLPSEYQMLKNAVQLDQFPSYARWNYGTIEDDLLKGFEGESITGDDILLGNSATLTCNHLDGMRLLKSCNINGRRIVSPLSYGDESYGDRVRKAGNRLFGEDFRALINFMPAKDYVATIMSCGFVLMNHKRQQAVGNIVIMLYLGARVFLREENPLYSFFKQEGVVINSIQDLEHNRALLNIPLTETERKANRDMVSVYWSRGGALERTNSLVKQALELKGKSLRTVGLP
jgi:dTDP-N-acetylfucosamine:lipid II N-acetylfucosaminyltransferase